MVAGGIHRLFDPKCSKKYLKGLMGAPNIPTQNQWGAVQLAFDDFYIKQYHVSNQWLTTFHKNLNVESLL